MSSYHQSFLAGLPRRTRFAMGASNVGSPVSCCLVGDTLSAAFPRFFGVRLPDEGPAVSLFLTSSVALLGPGVCCDFSLWLVSFLGVPLTDGGCVVNSLARVLFSGGASPQPGRN